MLHIIDSISQPADREITADEPVSGSHLPQEDPAPTDSPAAGEVEVIELELFDPDESLLPGEAASSAGSWGGTIASMVLHAGLIAIMASITLTHHDELMEPPLVSVMTEPIEEVEEPPIEYVLANPDDRELEVRKVLNSTSTGLSKSEEPQLDQAVELTDEFNPDVPKPKIYDIPEGREIAERLIVRGTTGDSLVQIDSALDRVTWEIANHLQEQKVLVVWMLDASGSLAEQRAAIVKRLDRIYGELGALKDEELIPRLQQPLLSAVVAYGEKTHFLTPEPTNKFELIREAISSVPEDPSGQENVFTAVGQAVDRWSEYRARFGRRIMLIVVTDETGDDFAAHVPAISLCRRYGAIAYVLGPHAVFGRKKGFVPYVAPENGQTYKLPVDLGPETPMYDHVDIPFWYDGPQYEYLSSGFGPYALTRLVTETGGIYFSTHMTTMKGFSPEGLFKAEDLKPFEPDYHFGTPEDYLKDLEKHPLRMAVIKAAQISRKVQPEGTPQMELRVTPAGYKEQAKEAQKTVAKSGYFLNQLLSAFPKGIEKALDSEPSPRWRMTFCLAYGRLLAQRTRCLEYNLALAEMANALTPQDVGTKSNHWIFRPDDQLNYASSEKRNAELAEQLLNRVLEEAPGTPWAKLAERELRHPFGIRVVQRFIPPPPPKPPAPPNANPTPPKPKLLLAKEPPKKAPPKPKPKLVKPVLPRL